MLRYRLPPSSANNSPKLLTFRQICDILQNNASFIFKLMLTTFHENSTSKSFSENAGNTKMTREEIIHKFQNLNIWKSGGQRAAHKPLLVLYAIGKLLRDGSRLTPYTDIETNLSDLLQEFGPWRDQYNPADPFWRLQNDEVWEVTNRDKIRAPKDNASVTDLRKHKSSGGFPEVIANQLQNDLGLAFEVIGRLLASHFPITYHEDILQTVGIELSFRFPTQSRDPNFRHNILEAYNHRCAICGFNVTLRERSVALEAAHIKWQMAEGPDREGNGIALCSLHHKLFDRGAFTLTDQLVVQVSNYVDRSSTGFEEWLQPFNEGVVNFPPREAIYYPDPNFIDWHVREVFRGNYRESINEHRLSTSRQSQPSTSTLPIPNVETEPVQDSPLQRIFSPDLTSNEQTVFNAIGAPASHIDVIVRTTQLPINQVSSVLLTLELKGMVQRLPGNQFIRGNQ